MLHRYIESFSQERKAMYSRFRELTARKFDKKRDEESKYAEFERVGGVLREPMARKYPSC